MFSKQNKDSSKNGENSSVEKKISAPSIISADLIITGDMISEGEIQVDGKVEGDIRCHSLLVGVDGCVLGSVRADIVRIHGSITGQVLAKSIFLASTARMAGDITHESLAIEPGAFVEGLCRHMADPIPAEQGVSDLMLTDERLSKISGKVSNINVDKKESLSLKNLENSKFGKKAKANAK